MAPSVLMVCILLHSRRFESFESFERFSGDMMAREVVDLTA